MAILVQTVTASAFAFTTAAVVMAFPTPNDLWEVVTNPSWRTPESILISEAARAQDVLTGQPLGLPPSAVSPNASIYEVSQALETCVSYLNGAIWPDVGTCRETVETVAYEGPIDVSGLFGQPVNEETIRAAVEVCRVEWLQAPLKADFDLDTCLPTPVMLAL